MSDAPCRADQHSIELLLGAQVEQTKRIADGSSVCEYIVRPATDLETGMQGAESLPVSTREPVLSKSKDVPSSVTTSSAKQTDKDA
jgi:hypothetical protein